MRVAERALLLGLFCLGACSNATEPPLVVARATVIEGEYANFAWTPTQKGFVVDSTGAVYTFDLAGKMWNPSDVEHPTRAEIEAKHSASRTLVRTLSASETAELFSLAEDAINGSLGPAMSRCNDAGTLMYSVYHDLDQPRAERVLLRAEGDDAAQHEVFRTRAVVASREARDPATNRGLSALTLLHHASFTPLAGGNA